MHNEEDTPDSEQESQVPDNEVNPPSDSMAKLTKKQQDKLELLEASLAIQNERGILPAGGANPALCASIKREERLQYNFMIIYQVIVLILAMAVLALLLFAAWGVVTREAFQAVTAGAGALVSGAAAAFLRNQRKDARDTYAAARALLEKHNCP